MRGSTGAVLLVMVFLAGCAAPPSGPDPSGALPDTGPPPAPAGQGENLWLLEGARPAASTRVSAGAEPSILADKDGRFLWIGDTRGGYYSTDNGSTWDDLPYFLPPSIVSDGWALAQDDEGRLYAAALTGPEIEVAVSEDGRTWDNVARAVGVSGVADRPWLSAKGDGEVAMIWYDYFVVGWEACVRSTDAGRTWLDHGKLNGALPQGGNLVHTADGAFHFVNDDGRLHTYRSSCMAGPAVTDTATSLGANNMIQLATIGDGLYSASANAGNKAIQVWAQDGTRASTLQVSPSVLRSSTFATISTHEPTGEVAVAWYGSETPGDPSRPDFDGAFNVFVARITDFWGERGGPFIVHERVTTEPNHVGDICMNGIGCDGDADRDLLDYFMIDHDIWGGLHVAYGHDGAGSQAEVRYAHLMPLRDRPEGGLDDDQPPVLEVALDSNGLRVHGSTAGSFDPDGDALTFTWDMGDGESLQGPEVDHTYAAAGVYTVLVEARAGDQVTRREMDLTVEAGARNAAPTARIEGYHGTPEVGSALRFVDGSTDPEGALEQVFWDFGDGTTKTGAPGVEVTHTYAKAAVYSVTLTAVDAGGASSSVSVNLQVAPASGPVDVGAPPADSEAPALPILAAAATFVAIAASRRRIP